MNIRLIVLSALFLLFPVLSSAQEGHPLKGTWRGEIAMPGGNQPLVIIMNYKDDQITGMINPGRSSFNYSSSEFDAPNWTLHARATTRDGDEISFMATLNEIGARNRYLEGMWSQAGASYPFTVSRE